MRITIDIEPSPRSPVPDMLLGAAPFLVPLLMRFFQGGAAPDFPDPSAAAERNWSEVIDDIMRKASAQPARPPRLVPLGFRSSEIKPGESCPVVARPQVPFRGTRLVVLDPSASAFAIESLRVGNVEQLAQVGPGVPATMFRADTDGAQLQLDSSQPGTDIVITVKNVSDKPLAFEATMFGETP